MAGWDDDCANPRLDHTVADTPAQISRTARVAASRPSEGKSGLKLAVLNEAGEGHGRQEAAWDVEDLSRLLCGLRARLALGPNCSRAGVNHIERL